MNRIEMSTEVVDLLNGEDLTDKQHEAMMLLTVSEDGWPHTAMISVGEIVAISGEELRIGLWPDTSTTANIIHTNKATLVLFWRGKAHYIRLSIERLKELPTARYQRERFLARVVSAREDVAKYADITSGIKIKLKNSKEVVERWGQTIEDIRR
ncbi:pyridoxamine 5'-phosphate oxidase family protein [Peribacillus sp. TH16]|uniref:pyridoxamine 5'-phosphate oxidase family protein n=1 Tax=unclassified Peribacillus TaxID=2675266 RepID=UPI001913EA9F|nr:MULTISPECIES: pyridoxamine 5'-phosphate oxidase family protein [unclassified Peribacillus]MBK5458126.1 pyridoxamine 5'-phosphate oxidase family protein [Peribacillus sp. TH27]MBK5482769.1 pyridoxamine 5'-phosphate oxidase family protein [Peribacillus sp. TH16]